MNEQLLDREIEINDILEIINKPVDNNKIIYLTGKIVLVSNEFCASFLTKPVFPTPLIPVK